MEEDEYKYDREELNDDSFFDDEDEESNSITINEDSEECNEEYSEFEYGEFAEDLKAIEEFNSHRIDFANREYDSSKASVFLEYELVDIEAVKSEIKAFLHARKEYIDRLQEYPPGSAKAWQVQADLNRKESALRHKLSLQSVGLTMDDIVDVADDYNHLIEDSYNENGRSLRKELKKKLKSLPPKDRE